MATKSFSAISQSIINNILTVNPDVDIKIGEAVRDLFIDVQASQLQDLFAIIDYSTKAQSVLTARGPQLDRLGYNSFQKRDGARRAVAAVTLIIKNGITAPTLINIGDQFSTPVDQTGVAYTFICAQTTLLTVGQVQATIPVIALQPGSASNVPANSIRESNYDFVDYLYNASQAIDGLDEETDAAFAARIPTFITGTYINVYNGIIKILSGIQNISESTNIVTPDQPLSRGQYKVDVYLQRAVNYFGTPVQETAPANVTAYSFKQQPLYELNPVNQVTVFDPSTNTTKVYPPLLGTQVQYVVQDNPVDLDYVVHGSTKAGQQLVWQIQPPTLPYVVDYNVDQTIVDAQNAHNQYNEIVADVLLRQARAIPIWVGASVFGKTGTSSLQVNQKASVNLSNLFGQLGIMKTLAPNNLVFSLLSDSNLTNVNIVNFDTSYEIVLTATGVDGNYTFGVTSPNSTFLINHDFTPLGLSYDNTPAAAVFQPFTVQGRLFITNPNRISQSGTLDLVSLKPGTGVVSADMIQAIHTNWGANVDTYYDSRSETLVVNFDKAPTSALVAATTPGNSVPTITFNIIQPYIAPTGNLSYLTLAPSLVSPMVLFPGSQNAPVYATINPNGLDSSRAKVYKNGVALAQSFDGVLGDYTLAGPDVNGVYQVTFLIQPATTDVLQYGLTNPDISINLS
jgi:hypothetical protein